MKRCTHCGGDNPRSSVYEDYFCGENCIGDHIESLLATQKSFAASLADRIAALEFARKGATEAERLIINREIGLIQAIAHDYTETQ